MSYNHQKPSRRSIRLKNYDYTQPGWYFITLIVKNRKCLLSRVSDAKIILTSEGKIVLKEWEKTAILRASVGIDAFIIMPNHFHGIIHIIEESALVTSRRAVTLPTLQQNSMANLSKARSQPS